MILCSVARVLLAILTKWPTSLTPTMQCTRSYLKQSVWNPDGMILDHIPWKKIFTNGNPQIVSNQKKFPVKLLRLALFVLGKCSQRKYPIKRFKHLLHLNMVCFSPKHTIRLCLCLPCGQLLTSSLSAGMMRPL